MDHKFTATQAFVMLAAYFMVLISFSGNNFVFSIMSIVGGCLFGYQWMNALASTDWYNNKKST